MFFYRIIFVGLTSMIMLTQVVWADHAPDKQLATTVVSSNHSQEGQSLNKNHTGENVKINLNQASVDDLLQIKGLTAYQARAIVSYRKKHGNFKSLDELTRIRGLTKLKGDALKVIQSQFKLS
jgi:competence ComEA-like helix-hairpin-helix protein